MSATETATTDRRAAASRELRWVALGDSFTAGTGPGELAWPALVHSRIARRRPLALLNLARIGARAGELEREQLPGALASGADLVTLICGGNDVIGSVRPPLARLERDLDRIFGRIGAEMPGAALLTATYPAIASTGLRPRTRRRIDEGIDELNSIIRELAGHHGVACVELADHPGRADLSNYADDGIHPSPAGHRAAAQELGSGIEELIAATVSTTGKEPR